MQNYFFPAQESAPGANYTDMEMNPKVDRYLIAGCGRCPLGDTPQCKVHRWREALEVLRMLVLDSGLTEELKWGVPCYTYNKNNVLIIAAFKEYCSLSFFKGSLLEDTQGVLTLPGENSRAARQFRFVDLQAILDMEPILRAYIAEAIEIEKAGRKVDFKQEEEQIFPEELLHLLESAPEWRAAFEALTPGRRRGYMLYFSQPKQSATRTSRIEKAIPRILAGKGLHDR